MKNIVLFLIFGFLSATASAGVEFRSFYFNSETRAILVDSDEELNGFIALMVEREFQVIELNGFSVSGKDEEDNRKIAENYIQAIQLRLDLENESQITVNNYGGNMIKLNFNPKSWDRVDVYYYIGRERTIKPDLVINDSYEVETNISTALVSETTEMQQSEMIMNSPIVMPIGFVGGKTKVKEDAYEYLDKLYETLQSNPDLFAHIRGHVCCDNKRLRSRKRAKVVYRYLIKKGISKDRLSFRGYSNSIPIVYPEITESDKSANRRVDIIFTTYKGRRHYL